jgi:hypothetical protein
LATSTPSTAPVLPPVAPLRAPAVCVGAPCAPLLKAVSSSASSTQPPACTTGVAKPGLPQRYPSALSQSSALPRIRAASAPVVAPGPVLPTFALPVALTHGHRLKPSSAAHSALAPIFDEAESQPTPARDAPTASSRNVADLPEYAQQKWKSLCVTVRVWAGELKNPWSIIDHDLEAILPVLWNYHIGDWNIVELLHRQIARNIVSRMLYLSSIANIL